MIREEDDLFSNKTVIVKKKKHSKLTKEEEKVVKALNLVIPPKIKNLRTKVQLIEYWKAIFIALLSIVLFFLYFESPMINIWAIRAIEIILTFGIIFLAERVYRSFKEKEFITLLELIFYNFALLITSEMQVPHPLFNGTSLLILSFCYIIYYIFKGIFKSRIIYAEYVRSRSDIKEILKDNRESYI